MKLKTATLLGLSVLLAACGQKPEGGQAAETAATSAGEMTGMSSMPMATPTASAADGKMGKGSGTVTAVDEAGGTITLNHGPIPEVNWPAMTMTFTATPDVLAGAKAGDKVNFDVSIKDGGGEVTAITKSR